ncbi:MAG: hypothetical protein HOM37_06345 [Acidimicrobiaceae bacterium]|jgi:hypothetical protein|nr:hypothetical protein [Acidimicrobiaceae bacterium]MBT5581437.1 hypothetical protein [Acidimicrobiaceae bacterium]
MRVHAERFTSIERHTPRSKKGRVCEDDDCETQLSIYNEQSFCSFHGVMVVARMRGKVLED